MRVESFPTCPLCGCEADWFYRMDGEIIGCSECVERVSYRDILDERDGDDEYAETKRWQEEGV